MSNHLSQASIDTFAHAVQRVRDEPGFRNLVLVDLPAAMKEVGLSFPDRATIRKSLESYGLSEAELSRFDGAKVADSAITMATAGDQLESAKPTSNEFPRGVPGYVPGAFWWGFQLPMAYADVDDILNPFVDLTKAVTALTAALTALCPPLVPFALPILLWMVAHAIAIAAVKGGCQNNPASKGMWISMAWLAPGVFVPTCLF